MAGKVEARKGDGLTIWFEANMTVTTGATNIKIAITQFEADQLIAKMQEAMRWINNDQKTAEWEWGKDIES